MLYRLFSGRMLACPIYIQLVQDKNYREIKTTHTHTNEKIRKDYSVVQSSIFCLFRRVKTLRVRILRYIYLHDKNVMHLSRGVRVLQK